MEIDDEKLLKQLEAHKAKRAAKKSAAKTKDQVVRTKAYKAQRDLTEVKKKLSSAPPKRTGRVVPEEQLQGMIKPVQDLAKQNVLFEPNPGPQTDFLAAPETDVLYGGAAGGGKSYAMIIDPLRYCHIKDHRALILRKTLPELRELIDKTRELYPQAFPGSKYKETEKIWKFPSGASVEFGYLEKDADVYRYQGQAFTWIGFDEITHLASEFAWNYLGSRLRTTNPDIICYMRCTANPGGPGHAWVKKRYIENAEENQAVVYGMNPMTGEPLTRKFIPARLQDNPHLYKLGSYEAMLRSLPEVERKRLLEGDWDAADGAAFPEFSRNVHTIEPFMIPPDWNRIKAVDYGYTAPACCLWGAVHPEDGTVFIYRELYERGLTGEQLRDRMTELESEEYRGIIGVLDGACWNRTGNTGPTLGEVITKGAWGHKLRPADKNRKAGKVQVHEYLRTNSSTGMPGIIIFNTCQNLIREMLSIPLSKTDSEDVDTHVDDHAYDALRYLLMSRPRKETMAQRAFRFKSEEVYTPADARFGY